MMKYDRRRKQFVWKVVALLSLLPVGAIAPGCGGLVGENLVSGLRDGSITATTGIIEGFFNNRFSFDTFGEEGGDDLFVKP